MDLFQELVAIVAAFDARGIDYALCGAVALAIHGAPRATKDIDVLARAGDMEAVREATRSVGFTLESLPMTFSSSGVTVRRFTKVIAGDHLMLDVLIVDGPLDAVWATREALRWNEGEVRVVSRQGLITLKLAAGRPQDLADIQRLEELDRG